MKNKGILIFLLSLTLSGCQRETYQPTGTPGATEEVVSTTLSALTATPGDPGAATPQPDWETFYTEANPVTDSEELIAILQDLYNRFMAQFDRPGWYRFYGGGDLGEQVFWVHISAPESRRFDGLLELYDFPEHYAPGFIWPTTVVGPEGQVGFTHGTEALDDYYFVERPDVFSFLDDLEPTLDNLGYFAGDVEGIGQFGHLALLRRIEGIQNPVHDHGGARRESSYAGWVGTYEGQPVFVIKMITLYSGVLPVMESGERLVRDESYTYFDLRNGGAIATKSDYWYQSGNTDEDDWWMDNYHLVDWFETLPDREQQIYDEALRRLDEFNQSGMP
jgi:hypothetical protein